MWGRRDRGEGYAGKGRPKVFSKGGRDGLFTVVRELPECVVVLRRELLAMVEQVQKICTVKDLKNVKWG